ncbi:MAG: heme o synthase [Verrucomicrobiota bacterium]
MKAVAEVQTLETPQPVEKSPSQFAIFSELIKARLTTLVLLTTAVGFYLAARGPLDWMRFFHALFGTALVAGGAAALNQFIEREHDAKMERTEDRPLPSGNIQPETVLIFGGIISCAGLIYLATQVNLLTSILGIVTLLSYLFVYTPLKRLTTLNTVIGAIPGALPPLMGWTAARGEINIEGWSLFAILFFWQLPHFLAIAWMYREDYARGGYMMLPVVDPEGIRTGKQAVSHTLGLISVSLFPFLLGLTGGIYCAGAIVFGAIFLVAAIRFSNRLTVSHARQLFFASIIYLPLLLGLMIFDKIKL